MDLIKLKRLHSKGNHKQNEKTTHRMGENICKQCNWRGIILQNTQTAHAAQCQRNRQPSQKMVIRPKYIFFQRRHTDGQQAREKMLNITNNRGNVSQNHNEISPHTCQNGYYQKDKK